MKDAPMFRRLMAAAAPPLRRALRDLRHWGVPGAAAAVAAAVTGVLVFWLVPAEREALASAQQAAADSRREAQRARAAVQFPSRVDDPGARFLDGFPVEEERHRRIAHLLSLASRDGLQTRRGDVRSVAAGGLGLRRIVLVVPMAGRYESLRRYVDQALRDDPALSLDRLLLERADARTGELRAEMHWSLWMREGKAAGASSR